MTTFANYFTPEDLARLVAFSAENPRPEGAHNTKEVSNWYTKLSDAREEIIVKAMMEFFKAKLKTGELKPVPNIKGRAINFTDFWDALITGQGDDYKKKWALEAMENTFSYLLISPGCSIYKILYMEEDGEKVDVDAIYKEFIEYIDAGNFAWHSTSQSMNCGITGEYLAVQFEDWTPVVGNADRNGFKPCVPIEPRTAVETLQIEFKTGDLVAMDWFRDEEGTLREFFKSKGADALPSINSEIGVLETTRFYANLGVVHVMVGNSSPNVFTQDGLIAVGDNWCAYTADGRERYSDCDDDGNESEEAAEAYEFASENPPEGMVDHGRVCTDLWWVTIMERSRLIEIFVEQRGEEHRAEIEAYAASEFDVNMQVEPGKYTLHFDGYPSTFYSLLDDKKKFRIGTPYFALTKDPA